MASAALTKIFRQQIPALRAAIEDLSQGKTEEGFDKLDAFGMIREVEKADERLKAICHLHIGAIREKQSFPNPARSRSSEKDEKFCCQDLW